jgi:TATA-box binding protein (TBP) (component of TFIID and TFIIIB)
MKDALVPMPTSKDCFCPEASQYLNDMSYKMLVTSEKMTAKNVLLQHKTGIVPSQLRLSTMTVFARLNVPADFQLARIIDVFLLHGEQRIRDMIGFDVHVVFPVRKSKNKVNGKQVNNFFNQLTMWYKQGTKKSVKLFINGNVHVTGCQSTGEYVSLMRSLCKFMDLMFPESHAMTSVRQVEIQMINSKFGLGVGLDLSRLQRIALGAGLSATYDREVYPGLNIKVPTSLSRYASVLVFISGNIIITGVKDFFEIYEAYDTIVDSIANNLQSVQKARIASKKNDRNKSSEQVWLHGYESSVARSILIWDEVSTCQKAENRAGASRAIPYGSELKKRSSAALADTVSNGGDADADADAEADVDALGFTCALAEYVR